MAAVNVFMPSLQDSRYMRDIRASDLKCRPEGTHALL